MKSEAKIKNLDGRELARRVAEKFATRNVFSIARAVGLKIVYENWFPVTAGEFDKKKRMIFVNASAKENDEKIIAHELGHFFAQDLNMEKAEEETLVREFVDNFVCREVNLRD